MFLSLQGLENANCSGYLSPVIILGVPIVDTVAAIVRRKLSGVQPWRPGQDALVSSFSAMGFTHRGGPGGLCHRYPLFSLIALLLNVSSRFGGILL